jgi:hypothetical protein
MFDIYDSLAQPGRALINEFDRKAEDEWHPGAEQMVCNRSILLKKSRRNILRAIIEWRSYALQINLVESTGIDSLPNSIGPISSDYLPELHRFIRPVLGQILLLDFFNTIGYKQAFRSCGVLLLEIALQQACVGR